MLVNIHVQRVHQLLLIVPAVKVDMFIIQEIFATVNAVMEPIFLLQQM
jgi:hypothetical protein